MPARPPRSNVSYPRSRAGVTGGGVDGVASASYDAFEQALKLLVPGLADYSFLHLDRDGELTLAAARHRDPGLVPLLRRLLIDARSRMTAPGSTIDRVFRDGTARVSNVGPGPRRSGAGTRSIVEVLGPRSYAAVPVSRAEGRIGVLTLARFDTPQPYRVDDIPAIEAVAAQLTLLILAAEREEHQEEQLEHLADELIGVRESLAGELAAARDGLSRIRREREASEEALARAERAVEEAESARALAEAALAERPQGPTGLEAMLLDAVGEAVIAADPEQKIMFWNRAAERLLGWSRDEAIGRDLVETVPALSSKDRASEVLSKILQGEPWSGELRARRKDGSTFPAALSGETIPGPDGASEGLIVVSSNLTQRKELESRAARAAPRTPGADLPAHLAKEFTACAATILRSAELLRRRLETLDSPPEELGAIEQAARTLARLIRQRSSAVPSPVPGRGSLVSLNAILGGLEPALRAMMGGDITFDMSLSADPDHVVIDVEPIERALTTLALESKEHLPELTRLSIRSENVTVREGDEITEAHGLTAGPYVALLVQDDGVGFDRPFGLGGAEPFFSVDDVRAALPDDDRGLVGLFTATRENGGQMWVSSAPSQGTTVRILFPLAPTDRAVNGDAAVKPASRGPTVLLVEDDESVRVEAARALREDGYDVVEASDGVEALRIWERERDRVSLVLTDVVMPRMSGRALIDRLRTQRPDLPALFLSEYGDEAVALHGLTERRDPHLTKPFTVEALASAVREARARADTR